MTPTEPAEPGDVRFTPIGDVEVFDGESWNAIDPLRNDPETAMRNDPAPAGSSDPRPAGPPAAGPAGSPGLEPP